MKTTEEKWKEYVAEESAVIEKAVGTRGYTLNEEQPHTLGERAVMQAVTTYGGKKLILLAERADGLPVIIKGTRDEAGKRELQHEQLCRAHLNTIAFSYTTFNSPALLEEIHQDDFYIVITEFIAQSSSFLERPLLVQYEYALGAFKSLEATHASTANHYTRTASLFGTKQTSDYQRDFSEFRSALASYNLPELQTGLQEADSILNTQSHTIEQYCGFLTHTDFVPHNFRIRDNQLYLLDFSSLRFANKHETWARFLNFMTLYNPPLEQALCTYLEKNRAPEETSSLQAMRLYRLGEILFYYHSKLSITEGQLQRLNELRVRFWHEVLQSILNKTTISEQIRINYQNERDQLRSDDEKKRQINLH